MRTEFVRRILTSCWRGELCESHHFGTKRRKVEGSQSSPLQSLVNEACLVGLEECVGVFFPCGERIPCAKRRVPSPALLHSRLRLLSQSALGRPPVAGHRCNAFLRRFRGNE